MKRRELIFTGLAALAAGSTLAGPAPAGGIKLGQAAPGFEVKTLDGKTLSAHALRGKVVILSFWATWCGPCRQEMPALEAYYKAHAAQGLEIVAISMDDPNKDAMVRQVMSSYSFPAVLQRQAKVMDYGHVLALPMAFVIGRDGTLRMDGSQKVAAFDAASLDQIVTPLLKSKS